jgi:hypothetical protein
MIRMLVWLHSTQVGLHNEVLKEKKIMNLASTDARADVGSPMPVHEAMGEEISLNLPLQQSSNCGCRI